MLTVDHINDFHSFYEEHEEHFLKHYKDFAGKNLSVDKDLCQGLIDSGVSDWGVIKLDDEFIGYIAVSVTPSVVDKGSVEVLIEHFYIAEEHRSKGYGSEVLEQLEEAVRQTTAKRVCLAMPYGSNKEKLVDSGYKPKTVVLEKVLGE